jgi:hypothetical protein
MKAFLIVKKRSVYKRCFKAFAENSTRRRKEGFKKRLMLLCDGATKKRIGKGEKKQGGSSFFAYACFVDGV